MAAISSTSGASQYGLQQLKLQAAQRTADQAAQTALALKAQAHDAERTADIAQENARSLSVQYNQAESRAEQARQGVAALHTAQQSITQLSSRLDQVLGNIGNSATPTTTTTSPASSPAPVVNSQGQLTGTTINTTA